MKILFFFILSFLLSVSSAFSKTEDDLISQEVTIIRVSDGDTLELLNPLPGFAIGERVRILGIQAFEEYDETTGVPDCNATNATARLSQLLGCDPDNDCPANTKVTLKVWDTDQQSRGRPMRYVFKDGLDIGKQLVAEGYVLAFAHPDETLYNTDRFLAQQSAMNNKIGPLWNSSESQCSKGPGSGSDLKMWVNWDAPGDDSLPENRNGEWVKIKNNGDSTVNLTDWTLRDTSLEHIWKFPSNASISPGQTITIKVGNGSDGGGVYYMDQSAPMFENFIPEGVYLLDYWGANRSLTGEIRAHFIYPCLTNCTDPLQGKIQMSVNYDAPGDDNLNPNGEWVKLKNTSNEDLDLEMYLLHSDPVGSANYNFDDNSVIYPNETLQVYIGKGTDSRLKKYWGNSTSILTNEKDRVWLDTYDSIKIVEKSWPGTVSEPGDGTFVLVPIIDLLMK